MIGDAVVGKIIGADLFGAVGGADLFAAMLAMFPRRGLFDLVEFCAEDIHRFLRFAYCERSSREATTIPVGLWSIRTAVSTLLTFWPPGPPAREKVTSRSFGEMFTSRASTIGNIATLAVEVCTRPAFRCGVCVARGARRIHSSVPHTTLAFYFGGQAFIPLLVSL